MSIDWSVKDWPTWGARLGYCSHEDEVKPLAYIEFQSPNMHAAQSYARRQAEALFDSGWGPYWEVVGPLP